MEGVDPGTAAAASTPRTRVRETGSAPAALAVTETGYSPVCDGVPERIPAEDRDSPGKPLGRPGHGGAALRLELHGIAHADRAARQRRRQDIGRDGGGIHPDRDRAARRHVGDARQDGQRAMATTAADGSPAVVGVPPDGAARIHACKPSGRPVAEKVTTAPPDASVATWDWYGWPTRASADARS